MCHTPFGNLRDTVSKDHSRLGLYLILLNGQRLSSKGSLPGPCIVSTNTSPFAHPNLGTCVLIPTSMSISKVFRVHYEHTNQERDALCIDLRAADNQILCMCSTHLESLIADPPLRPGQLATASK